MLLPRRGRLWAWTALIAVGFLATTLAQPRVLAHIPLQNLLKNVLHTDRSANAAFFFWIGLPWYIKPLLGVALAVMTTLALAACDSGPPPHDAIGIDDLYGIPAGSVPPELLRPDGLMTNGLLPAQPYDTGG